MSVNIEIQGVKSNDDLAKEGQMKTEVQDAAKEGDMIVPLPFETVQPSRDIKETKTPEEKNKQAEKVIETESQSVIRDAAPKQAKVRQVRKRKVVEPMPPAGTPSIDYLKQMQDRFDKLEGMMHEWYKDIPRVAASETPMQAYGVPSETTKRARREAPNYTNDYQEYDRREHLPAVPMHNSRSAYMHELKQAPRQEPNQDIHQGELYRRRTKDALDNMIYDSESTMANREQNSVTQTQSASGRNSHWHSKW